MSRDRRTGRRLGAGALAVVLGAGAATVVLPDRLRIDHEFPLVDAVAWRPHASVASLAAAGLLAVRPSPGPRASRSGRSRPPGSPRSPRGPSAVRGGSRRPSR